MLCISEGRRDVGHWVGIPKVRRAHRQDAGKLAHQEGGRPGRPVQQQRLRRGGLPLTRQPSNQIAPTSSRPVPDRAFAWHVRARTGSRLLVGWCHRMSQMSRNVTVTETGKNLGRSAIKGTVVRHDAFHLQPRRNHERHDTQNLLRDHE